MAPAGVARVGATGTDAGDARVAPHGREPGGASRLCCFERYNGGMPLSHRTRVTLFTAAFAAVSTLAVLATGLVPQPDTRREFTVVARRYAFEPDVIEVQQDDLVKITLRSADIPHSFTLDRYRIAKRVAAGGETTFEFRADEAGTFTFYCNLKLDDGCRDMRGRLVVRPRE